MFIRLLLRSAIVLFASCIFFNVSAQDVDLAIFTGYGSYSLTALKKHRAELLTDIPLDMKVGEDFPDYLIYGGSIRFNAGKIPMGISARFGSTGSRASYSDYSGSMILDELVRYVSIGTEIGQQLHTSNRLDIKALLRYWLNFNQVKFTTVSHLKDQNSNRTQIDCQSVTSAIAPAIMVEYKMKRFKFFFDAGYEVQFASKIKLSSNNNLHLIGNDGEPVRFDASGYRINVGIAVKLSE